MVLVLSHLQLAALRGFRVAEGRARLLINRSIEKKVLGWRPIDGIAWGQSEAELRRAARTDLDADWYIRRSCRMSLRRRRATPRLFTHVFPHFQLLWWRRARALTSPRTALKERAAHLYKTVISCFLWGVEL